MLDNIIKSLRFDQSIFLMQIVTFLLLWTVMTAIYWKPVLARIQARQRAIEEAHDRVEATRKDIEALRTDYQTRIAEIESDARSRIQTAIKEAQTERERVIAEARAQTDAILKQGVADLEREKNEALAGMREQIARLALDVTSKALGSSADEKALSALIATRVQRN
jgi:F-type H+-transporting ATPase subunit b